MNFGKGMKRLTAILLSAMFSLSIAGTSAASLSVNSAQSDSQSEGNYIEGQAIVCVKSSSTKFYSSEDSGLLADAQTLMEVDSDITDDIEDSQPEDFSQAFSTSKILNDLNKVETFVEDATKETEKLMLVESDSLSTNELVSKLENLPNVVFAEPNYIFNISETGDFSQRQWAYNGKYGAEVEQWNEYTSDGKPNPKVSSDGVVVAVLDTGIDYTHEDLKNVMWDEGENYSELTALGGGEYGFNGFEKSIDGKITYDSADPMDDNAHGTHCAGIIAAEWNKQGVSGITSGASLMAVKAGDYEGRFPASVAVKGYNYIIKAKEAGVNVRAINCSWGGAFAAQAMNFAVTEAGEKGIVSCWASGNDSRNNDYYGEISTSLRNNPYKVSVNSVNSNGKLSSFSNYGARTTDVAAPGERIYSTVPYEFSVVDQTLATPKTGLWDKFDRDEVSGEQFQYTAENAELSISEDGYNGGRALSVVAENAMDGYVGKVSGIDSSDLPKIAAFMFRHQVESNCIIYVFFQVKLTDGSWSDMQNTYKGLANGKNVWIDMSFNLPQNTDYSDFTYRIMLDGTRVNSDGTKTPVQSLPAFISSFVLTNDGLPYDYMSGTSMATPVVTGEAAVLAAKYPDESADKIAARIIGSVNCLDSLKGKCVSDGEISLKKALEGDTVPVLKKCVKTGDNKITVNGFFFGDNEGTLTIDGQTAEIISWSDTSVTAAIPMDLQGGEKLIEITTADSKQGHQYFTVGTPSNLYEQLPLPDKNISSNHEFYTIYGCNLCGLNGKLYYVGENCVNNNLSVWCYDPESTENNGWSKIENVPQVQCNSISSCIYNGKLVIQCDQYTITYNPTAPTNSEWSWFEIPAFQGISEASIVNSGKGIYLVGGTINGEYVKNIYKIDIEKKRAVKQSAELVNTRTKPALCYAGDGKVYISLGSSGNNIVEDLELMTIDDKGVKVTQVCEKAYDSNDYYGDQKLDMNYGAVENGMVITGMINIDELGKLKSDTYHMSFDGENGEYKFVPSDRIVATNKLVQPICTAYRGKYYIIAHVNDGGESGMVFAADDSYNTLALPGDTAAESADYSKVDAALAMIPEDLSMYTDESVAALNAAVNAVERGLDSNKQQKVNAMAKTIEDAINNLQLKPEFTTTEVTTAPTTTEEATTEPTSTTTEPTTTTSTTELTTTTVAAETTVTTKESTTAEPTSAGPTLPTTSVTTTTEATTTSTTELTTTTVATETTVTTTESTTAEPTSAGPTLPTTSVTTTTEATTISTTQLTTTTAATETTVTTTESTTIEPTSAGPTLPTTSVTTTTEATTISTTQLTTTTAATDTSATESTNITETTTEIPTLYGDATGDGKITAADVLIIRKSIAGQTVTLNSDASDVNCDGKLTAADVLMIRKFIAGQNIVLGK